MKSQGATLFTVLESDLRQLSSDARRSEGFVGWLSGPEHPQIKEAAERALLKLRQCEGKEELVKESKEVLKPFLIACDVKSPKLVSVALVSIQRMLANNAVAVDCLPPIVDALEQVQAVHDEGVNLKLLQTALTLFQFPGQDVEQEQVRRMLGICFRLLSNQRNSDSVLNTAAATVRQAVALVFDHVRNEGVGADAGGGEQATAALQLLDDLCLLAVGQEAQWIKTPPIPSAFVLDVLDFVLSNTADVFRTIPEFEHALLVRICQLLINQLQELLDRSKPDVSDSGELRVILRVVRTVVRNFCRQLKAKVGVFLETLLDGVAAQRTLLQRILIMQVFRSWCSDSETLQFLFETYDMRQDCKLKAVERMVNCFADTVDSTLRLAAEFMEEDPLGLVASLYYTRQNGKSWTLDMDFGTAPSDVQLGYLALLAIDSLLNVVMAQEMMVDRVLDPASVALMPTPSNSGTTTVMVVAATVSLHSRADSQMPELRTATAMVEGTWRLVLQALSQLMARCDGEVLLLQLLRGYQAMTQACGMLGLTEARDAFLSSLCDFALVPLHASASSTADSVGGAAADGGAAGGGSTSGHRDSVGSPGASPSTPLASTGSGVLTRGTAGGPVEVGDGLILTPKNVQALRTLFNVAHRLQSSLGPSWVLVLETLSALDRILSSPHTTTQELSTADGRTRPSDLAILSTAATQLFESTSSMTDEGAVELMAGLREASRRVLPSLQAPPGGLPRLYPVNRMVEVLLVNPHRLPPLWEIFVSHTLDVVTSSAYKPAVRAAALDCLSKAISGLLFQHQQQQLATASTAGGGSSPVVRRGAEATAAVAEATSKGTTSGRSAAEVEAMTLSVLERVYDLAAEHDIRMGVLRVTMTVLQHHGEQMGQGWASVLRLLRAVSASEDVELIRLAFQCVQLVCSDYLSVMPFQLMHSALEVASAYGAQQADLNVSLTTISLLWNAADVVGKLYDASGASMTGGVGGENPSSRPSSSSDGAPALGGVVLASALVDESGGLVHSINLEEYLSIIGVLFAALQALCTDPRPEVRNSGIRTLFSVVTTSGPRLSVATWEKALWEMLFPLVRTVHHLAATSSREEAEGASLGRGQRMLVHHSRNSEQKRWDETLVLALGGLGKIFKSHLPQLQHVHGLEEGWEELMLIVESSMAGGRKETALAATSLVATVLMAHAGSACLPRAMWRRSLRALDVGVEAATSPSCMVPLPARLELVNSINQLYMAHRSSFNAPDLRQLFGWVEKFCRNPCSTEDITTCVPGTMPPVQRAIMALLPNLAPVPLPEAWPDAMAMLLRLLRPHVLEQGAAIGLGAGGSNSGSMVGCGMLPGSSQVAASPVTTASMAMQRMAYSSTAMERVVRVLLDMYIDHMPWQAKASEFSKLVSALGRCAATRFTVYHANLWRTAASALCGAVTAGLPAVNVAAAEDPAAMEQAWESMAEAFEAFLLGSMLDTDQLQGLSMVYYHAQQQQQAAAAAVAVAAVAAAAAADDPDGVQQQQQQQQSDGQHMVAAGVAGEHHPRLPSGGSGGSGSWGNGYSGALPSAEAQLMASDLELEAAVLDSLTDVALTTCTLASQQVQRRLVRILDRGVARPRQLSVPGSELPPPAAAAAALAAAAETVAAAATSRGGSSVGVGDGGRHERFPHACLRKLYVLCSRGAQAQAPCLLQVAQLALPMLLGRCNAVLRSHVNAQRSSCGGSSIQPAPYTAASAAVAAPAAVGEEDDAGAMQQQGGAGGAASGVSQRAAAWSKQAAVEWGTDACEPSIDEVTCVLEVAATMTVAPQVVDALLEEDPVVGSMVLLMRARAAGGEAAVAAQTGDTSAAAAALPPPGPSSRERSHLLFLYGALTECVELEDPLLRGMARNVLRLMGAELGLMRFA